MSGWTLLLIAAPVAAVVARRRVAASMPPPHRLDVAQSGQVFALAAQWLRAGDAEAARLVLHLVGADGWRFAAEEVVAVSQSPRIAAMADRMGPDALLAVPAGVSSTRDRLAQVETLVAVAAEIASRLGRAP